MMLNKKGNIYIVLMIFLLIMSGIVIITNYTFTEKYNASVMLKRYRSRYLAESIVDIQRHFLQNQLDNTTITLLYREEDGDFVLQNSTPLFDEDILRDGFTNIEAEVSGFLRSTNEIKDILGNVKTELRLENPFTLQGLRVENLCPDPQFWIEGVGDKTSYEDYICPMKDLMFTSTVSYLGGEINVRFTVTGLKLIREPFTAVYSDGVGEAEALVLTDDMEVIIESYQHYKRGGLGGEK